MNIWLELLDNAPKIGTAFGAGSAPFVAAILANKLRPNGQFKEQRERFEAEATKQDQNAKDRELLLQSELARTYEAKAASDAARDKERERADLATGALADLARESGASMVHLLESLRSPQGGTDASG